jgi:hypothetical protein
MLTGEVFYLEAPSNYFLPLVSSVQFYDILKYTVLYKLILIDFVIVFFFLNPSKIISHYH